MMSQEFTPPPPDIFRQWLEYEHLDALNIQPVVRDYLLKIQWLNHEQAKLVRATPVLERLLDDLATHPLPTEVLMQLGALCSSMNFSERATQFYQRVVTAGDTGDYHTLAKMSARLKDYPNAERFYAGILERDPNDAVARKNLPQIQKLAKEARDVQQEIERQAAAVEFGPSQLLWSDRFFAVTEETLRARLVDFLARPEARLQFPKFEQPLVSMLILAFNKAEYTFQCLLSLLAYTGLPYEIILVDNHSTDETPALLKRLDNVRVIHNETNLGFVGGNNQAAQFARGEHLLLLNSDVRVTPHWLPPLLNTLAADPQCGAVGPKLVWPNGGLQEAGSIIWQDGTALGYGREDNSLRPEYNYCRPVDFVSGACLLVRRHLFEQLGGFDTRFAPAYYEDSDLCLALQQLGYHVIYQPHATVFHHEFTSSSRRQARRLMETNHQAFVEKWQTVLAGHHPARPGDPAAVLQARQRYAGRRVLVMDDRIPAPRLGAGFPRARRMLEHLAELGYAVTFVPLTNSGRLQPDCEELQALGIEVFYDVWAKPEKILEARAGFYDIVIVSRPHNGAAWLKKVRRYQPQARLVYDAEAIFALREIMWAELSGQPLPQSAREQMIAGEISVMEDADVVLTVSEAEKKVVQAQGVGARVDVWSTVHPLCPPGTGFAGRQDLLFVGGFTQGHPPNTDAVIHFVNHIFPKIQARLPGVKFYIVGNNPSDRVRQLASDSVVVTGFVEDLREYFDRCRVFVVPLRFGGGISLKLTEAMSHGIPAVVSGVAAQGLDLQDGVQLLIAQNDDDFARKVVELYTNPGLWANLSQASLDYVEANFSPEAMRARLAHILDQAFSAPEAAPVPRPPDAESPPLPAGASQISGNWDKPGGTRGDSPRTPVQHPVPHSLPGRRAGRWENWDRPLPADIVIVTYNSVGTITACLDSIFENTALAGQVVVVDNASTDDTRTILARYGRQISTIFNAENRGFSAACNQGIRASNSQVVVLLNPDTMVTPGWLPGLLHHFEPDVAAVGPLSNYVAGLQNVDYHLPHDTPSNLALPDLLARLEQRRGRHYETRLLVGFCLALARPALAAAGLLDERLFLGNDDLELSWRLRQQGFRLRVAADTFVVHQGQASFKTQPKAVTERLVQHSTDQLYVKLQALYGDNNVPHPLGLWGVDWFKPAAAHFRPAAAPDALTSIIVLTHNQLAHTRRCLDSIFEHTVTPFELIVVDNGSSDDTLDYLREVQVARPNVRLVANPANIGFAAGNNQGLALAGGSFVLLLNNDTVVTQGWLSRMLAVFERHPDTGLVGPVSNAVSGPQLVADVPYQTGVDMHRFAATWAAEHAGQTEAIYRVVGFCLLAKRALIDKIGGLDERFGSGNFEDDDFCLRAALAGYKSRIAQDVFIHHVGGQTFKAANIDYRQNMQRNWDLFKTKWNLPAELPLQNNGGYQIRLPHVTNWACYFELLPPPEEVQKLEIGMAGVRQQLARAAQAQAAGDWPQAAALFAAALKHPAAAGDAAAWNNLGYCYVQLGQPAEATAAFERGLELAPANLNLLNNLAHLYLQQEQFDRATGYLNQALRVNPDDVPTLLALGNVSIQLGAFDVALAAFERVRNLAPKTEGIDEVITELTAHLDLQVV